MRWWQPWPISTTAGAAAPPWVLREWVERRTVTFLQSGLRQIFVFVNLMTSERVLPDGLMVKSEQEK